MMDFPTVQEKSEQIFLAQPKAHQFKFVETNKMVPMDPLWLMTLFKAKQPVTLTSSRRRNSQRRRRWLISLLLAAMTQTTGIIIARTATTIKVGNAIVTNTDTIMASFNAKITPIAKRRTSRKSLIRREMTSNVITSRRRTRSYTMTTPLL
jgi:hypothetical protein